MINLDQLNKILGIFGAVIATVVLPLAGLMFYLDGKQDDRVDDLRTDMDKNIADLRTDMDKNIADIQSDMDALHALVNSLIAELDEEGVDFRNKIDANSSELRDEMLRHNERFLDLVELLALEQREHGEQISRLETLVNAEQETPDAN